MEGWQGPGRGCRERRGQAGLIPRRREHERAVQRVVARLLGWQVLGLGGVGAVMPSGRLDDGHDGAYYVTTMTEL